MNGLGPLIRRARKRLLRMHYDARVGHIGGNLSALDALMVLHHKVMREDDVFVLSKGHAAGALYVTLWSRGRLSDADLATFHADGTALAGHPVSGFLPEIPLATGSLGHGLPVAAGIALGRHLTGRSGHVYCLTSDGEWEEGSNWEALTFLAHRRLPNLTVMVDANGLQGFGTTREVASLEPLEERLAAFNLDVVVVDGHRPEHIEQGLRVAAGAVLLLRTVKGHGVSFMENRMEWHYLPLDATQFARAIAEIDGPAAHRGAP